MKLKSKQEAASNKKQLKRSFEDSEISRNVAKDNVTAPEARGNCFASSVDKSVLDRQPGFGKVRPTIESHQTNKGWDTLSSDSRTAPLPEQGVKVEIHQKYNEEGLVHTPDASTVS